MKKLVTAFVLLIAVCAVTATAQMPSSIAGNWQGYITVQGQQLIIKTHFTGDDTLRGTIDIPQQDASGLPLQDISRNADSLFFAFQAGAGLAQFKGMISDSSTIEGSYHQSAYSFPFKLRRAPEDSAEINTAPTAAEEKPYEQKNLIIKNDSLDIAGTLTRPESAKSSTLVIMISGSGAQDRDESMEMITDFRPFAVLADSLTHAGLATFRYDDRGMGESTGNFGNATLQMLAGDLEAIVNYFSYQSDQTYDKIILLGHSQGGIVGGKVAKANSAVAGLILMASPGVPLKDVLRYQIHLAYTGAGIDRELTEAEIDAREQLMRALRDSTGIDAAVNNYAQQFAAIQISAGVDSARAASVSTQQAQALRQTFASPQMESLLFYNPTEDLSQLDIPVLALFGGKDTQVNTELNRSPIDQALNEAGAPHEIIEIPNANHLFQEAETGEASEYGQLPSQFIDSVTSAISNWLKTTHFE